MRLEKLSIQCVCSGEISCKHGGPKITSFDISFCSLLPFLNFYSSSCMKGSKFLNFLCSLSLSLSNSISLSLSLSSTDSLFPTHFVSLFFLYFSHTTSLNYLSFLFCFAFVCRNWFIFLYFLYLLLTYMLTLESWRFPVLGEVSYSTRTLPNC